MKHSSPPNEWGEYIALLLRWNARINLVGRGDQRVLIERHIEDCLQLVPLIPAGVHRAIDVGSGAGFPGLVLAAATGICFELIESDRRKAAFLREAARVLRAPASVHPVRIEGAVLPPAELITARAFAPLGTLLAKIVQFLMEGGVGLFPKGTGWESELTDAEREWQMGVERFPSRTAEGAVILRITGLRRVPTLR